MRHADHDLVAAEVRSWYTDWPAGSSRQSGSTPDIGITTRTEPFGILRDGPGPAGRRLVLTVDDAGAVRAALDAAAAFYGTDAFDVWVDDRSRDRAVAPALEAGGFHAPHATVVLAHVGPIPAFEPPPGFDIGEVTDGAGLRRWAGVKLRGFADSEEEPAPTSLEAEVDGRRAEWPISRYELGVLGARPVAALAHYRASVDQMVFILATRLPYRRRGLARAMLSHWMRRARREEARSLLINCDENSAPEALYRRIGFVDDVYWHRLYRRL